MNEKIIIIALAGLSWLTPLFPFFVLVGIIIVWDTFLGVKLARKKDRFNSRTFARVLYKFLIYNVIIIIGYLLDKFVLSDFVGLFSPVSGTTTKAVVFAVVVAELISVDEKLRKSNGKGFKWYFGKIKDVIKALNDERKNI